MKKRYALLFAAVAIHPSLLVNAQTEVLPSEWKTFVSSGKNTLVTDTFMYQSFGDEARNNWSYTVTGGAEVFDASKSGVDGQKGSRSLKLPLGSGVEFKEINSEGYEEVTLSAYYAGSKIMQKEQLSVIFVNKDSGRKEVVIAPSSTASFPFSFNYGKRLITENPLRVQGAPRQIMFKTASPAADTKQGFYCIDLVTAYGQIPSSTLFTGNGDWASKARWSHLPATRQREALIQGNVTVTAAESCGTLKIANGKVTVENQGSLSISNELVFYQSASLSPAFLNRGSLQPPKSVSLVKEFPRKGVWYFVSFPFNVYASGITGFTQKDGTPNKGGNYFYVKYYDSEQRAATGLDSENWTTLNPPASTTPVFQKNKGYLIAIDEGADSATLTFRSKSGDIPSSFAANASLSIPFYPAQANVSEAHSGWYLCGNPFPAPMSLALLQGIAGVGDYAYCYDGNTYQVYQIGSDEEIPPFGAFFLKVEDDCSFKLRQGTSSSLQAKHRPSFALTLSDGKRADKATFLLPASSPATKSSAGKAYKLLSPDASMPQLAACSADGKELLAVSTLTGGESVVPLHLTVPCGGNYTLACAPGRGGEKGLQVRLIDQAEGDTIALCAGAPYTFHCDGACDGSRFSLLVTCRPEQERSSAPTVSIKEGSLLIENLPASGIAHVTTPSGKVCQRIALPEGSSRSCLTAGTAGCRVWIESEGNRWEVQ